MLLLAGCSGGGDTAKQGGGPPDLESAAIARGMITDPEAADLTGLYARDTDRLCIRSGQGRTRIGIYVDYGEGIGCSASGEVRRSGEAMYVRLPKGCSFEARYDGERISFPATVPDACAALCTKRATLGAVEVLRLSESPAEAAALRDGAGRHLCAD